MSEIENLESVKRAILRLNARDVDGYLEVFDKSVIFHGFSRKLKPGVGGLRDYYTTLLAGFPDMRISSEDMIADGEKVANRYSFYGTHRNTYMGIAPTSKLVVSPGMVIHHFRNGKIFETWGFSDNLGFLTQIGAVPAFTAK